MTEALHGNEDDVERNTAMADLFASLGAVAQAGAEHGHLDVPTVDLPAKTLDRAAEIYKEEAEA